MFYHGELELIQQKRNKHCTSEGPAN